MRLPMAVFESSLTLEVCLEGAAIWRTSGGRFAEYEMEAGCGRDPISPRFMLPSSGDV